MFHKCNVVLIPFTFVCSKLKGGYESGFTHVKPEEYTTRLFVYHGLTRTSVELSEVQLSKKSINSDDVFILDMGTKAYQWNGINASKDEKFKVNAQH